MYNYVSVPSSYPLNLTGEAVNSTTVLLSWQPPELEGRNGFIVSYLVTLTERATGQVLQFFRVGTHIDILITSLHPYYEYECTIAAATAIGNGPIAPIILFRLQEDGKIVK